MENKQKIVFQYIFLIFLSFGTFISKAQDTNKVFTDPDDIYLDAIVTDEDTIYINYLSEVELFDYTPLSPQDRRAYYRLRKKVLKVYPYALEASKQYVSIHEEMEQEKCKRKKKRKVKKQMKWIKKTFGKELKKLKRSEGRILIKLLHRNLQITAYDLVKEYNSGFKARMWQTFAGFYSIDMKAEYQPESDRNDQLIEMIIQKAINDDLIEESKLSPYQLVKIKKRNE
ncbi:MAG: DUF4294 domain-containing protein [Flavobacteriales bacterium]|jgi:hypothetical protein|nr:DUF4294 domain-containing protein [Flavobacteriales bacterium]